MPSTIGVVEHIPFPTSVLFIREAVQPPYLKVEGGVVCSPKPWEYHHIRCHLAKELR